MKHSLGVNVAVLREDTEPDYEFRYIDIGSVGTGELLSDPKPLRFESAPSRARRVVRRGDTLVSTVRTYLKAVWHAEEDIRDVVASTGFAVFTPGPWILPKFVGYACRSEPFANHVTAESVGVVYPAIAEARLASALCLCIPPLPEQRAIVSFLDTADRRILSYIRAKERSIELLEEQKQVIIHRAVTGQVDVRTGQPYPAYKDSGVEWLGEVPEHWEVRRLKTLSQIRYGLGQAPREAPDGLPLLRATNVSQGQIVEADMAYVDPTDVPTGRNAFLSEGEIIVVRSGAYTADSAIIPKRYSGAVTGYDMVVTVTEARPEFVAWAVLATYVRDAQLVVASLRAAQPHLNAEELGSAYFFLPPLPEQTAIVHCLDATDRRIQHHISATKRQIALLKDYRTRLIADVVTGKLDVREAAVRLPVRSDQLPESGEDPACESLESHAGAAPGSPGRRGLASAGHGATAHADHTKSFLATEQEPT